MLDRKGKIKPAVSLLLGKQSGKLIRQPADFPQRGKSAYSSARSPPDDFLISLPDCNNNWHSFRDDFFPNEYLDSRAEREYHSKQLKKIRRVCEKNRFWTYDHCSILCIGICAKGSGLS